MELKVIKQLGNSSLEVTINEKDLRDGLSQALFFTEPDLCQLCKSEFPIIWRTNKASNDEGTFTYIKRVCTNPKCNAASTAGEFKGGGFFWKRWEIYDPNKANDTILKQATR